MPNSQYSTDSASTQGARQWVRLNKAPDWDAIFLQANKQYAEHFTDFNKNVEEAIRALFAERQHFPDEKNWRGIRAIIQTIKQQAIGAARPVYSLSALPTGMGKTTALIQAVRELVRIAEAGGPAVGVLVLVDTLEQIPTLIKEMGLSEDQYAVRAGNKHNHEEFKHNGKTSAPLNSLGIGLDGDVNDAQVVFTTQQKLHMLTSIVSDFNSMYGLTFEGKPRAVRIWDESIIPADTRVMTWYDIVHLTAPLMKTGWRNSVPLLDTLAADMKARVGESLIVPDIPLPDPRDVEDNPAYTEADRITIENLVAAAEGRAKIRDDAGAGTVAIHYEEVLPNNFAPLLILDASGELRMTYQMWKYGPRGNLVTLPSGGKTYHNLTIRHWNHPAGKTAHSRTAIRRELAQGVAEAVLETTEKEVLIIVRKHDKKSQDMEAEIRKAVTKRFAVEGAEPPKLHFLTWGRHRAINDFRAVKHVIVVGLLIYSSAQAEALARGAGKLDMDTDFTPTAISKVNRGEIAHHLFQAMGRGAVRRAIGGDVLEGCKLDLVFSDKGNAHGTFSQRMLTEKVFPGATLMEWEPLGEPLKSIERAFVQELNRRAMSTYPEPAQAPQKDIAVVIDRTPANVWRIKNEPRVAIELARLGLVLQKVGKAWQVQKRGKVERRPEEIDKLRTAKRKQKLRRARRYRAGNAL